MTLSDEHGDLYIYVIPEQFQFKFILFYGETGYFKNHS